MESHPTIENTSNLIARDVGIKGNIILYWNFESYHWKDQKGHGQRSIALGKSIKLWMIDNVQDAQ